MSFSHSQAIVRKRRRSEMTTYPWNHSNLLEAWTWPHKFWMNLFCWWAEQSPHAQFIPLFKIMRVVFAGTVVVLLVGECNALYNDATNFFVAFTIGSACITLVKVFSLVRYRLPLSKAMDLLDELLKEACADDVDHELVTMIRKSFRTCWIITFVLLMYQLVVAIHWLARPILGAVLYNEKSSILMTKPLFIDTWQQVIFTNLFQAVALLNIDHGFYFHDNFYFCFSEVLILHFQILEKRLKGLVFMPVERRDRALAACVNHHIKLMKACYLLRDSTQGVIILQCTVTVIHTSCGVLQAFNEDVDNNLVANLTEIFISLLAYMYIYCYYATEVAYESKNVANYIYAINWEEWTVKEKKALVIMMSMSSKPLYFGGFVELNMNTFINVVKATFSIYNFLTAIK